MRITLLVPLLAATVLAGPGAAWAQQPPAPQPAPRYQEPATLDYQLGPGDLLSIRVSGLREFEQSTRVSNSGRIRVPFVGVFHAAGLTTVELEREIARLISGHELVNEPSVRVQVQEHRAKPTYIVGEVNAPGQFVITGQMYVLELISKAGGLRSGADDIGFLYRRNWPQPSVKASVIAGVAPTPTAADAAAEPVAKTPPPTDQLPGLPSAADEVIKIDLEGLRLGTRSDLNVSLQAGDILYIPRRRPRDIYIVGDVKTPGAYGLPRRGEVTAAQAIIYAGGPLRTAKTGSGFLMRHDETGTRQAVPVDFAAILKGKKPDFPVRPDDIIYIPSSTKKTIGVGMLDMIPGLVIQYLIF